MLVRFIVSNFLSFDSETEFNMLAGNLKTHRHHTSLGKVNLLKYGAIYGANGAGKSNLIKAIEYLRDIVMMGKISSPINSLKFKLNPDNKKKPVYFEIELETKSSQLIYGLTLNGNLIEEEWLYEAGINSPHKMIFERKSTRDSNEINVSPRYKKNSHQRILIDLMERNILKSNEILISKFDQLEIQEIIEFRNAVSEITVIFPNSKFGALPSFLTGDSKGKQFANDLLSTFDTGVSEISTESIDIHKYFGKDDEEIKEDIISQMSQDHDLLITFSGKPLLISYDDDEKIIVKKAVTKHKTADNKLITFEIEDESQGTQRLLDFIPAFHGLLNKDSIFIIDEIDQSIHPALLKTLLEKILANQDILGQLIFTTHESNLLDLNLLRSDEIWFAEKDSKSKSTHLYSLNEFKPRHDLDLKKGYLQGRFGGIPFLGMLKNLSWE
ncbi:AAA family ATPase [Sphingobacterium siyangense]|uniref:AAA family ATPase n=1 Tax=Sphingobacterium siyangense TaxID=459529 RepID=UPI003DA5E475